MVKGRPLLRWAGILLGCAFVSLCGIEAWGSKEPAKAPEQAPAKVLDKSGTDLIRIKTLAAYQNLELPPVQFFHDKHTDALLKEKKSCETCHAVENGKLSLAYKRKKTTKPAEIKDIYHSGCIGCHQEEAAAGKKTGPLDGFCRDCHVAEPPAAAARLDAGLDKVTHYRHVDSKYVPAPAGEKDNCGACHHEFDQKAKKLVYVKGKEATCRYCHLDKAKGGVESLEQAAHQQCVLCHLDLAKKENAPVRCADCHSAAGQALTAKKNQEILAGFKDKEVPRLKAGQQDAVLLTYAPKVEEGKVVKPTAMNPVPFNHLAHEKYSDNCRACHHATMYPCSTCHTLTGSKDGNFVTFEQAMHRKSSQISCNGCHAARQSDKNCIGCHRGTVETGQPAEASCKQCHMEVPKSLMPGGQSLAKLTAQQKSGMAADMLKNRPQSPGTYAEGDIPDKVIIKELSDKYVPVEFSHRKHVNTLIKGMKDDKLAAYFHSDPGTMCQGCHHNSPPSKNPPACASCHAGFHGKTAFDPREANRPGLLAALHGQCMACHKYMDVKPVATACIECHQEKKK